MTWFRSIQFRLAAWYFTSVIALLAILSAGSWYAMKSSIYYAIDLGLVNRMAGVIDVLHRYAGPDRTSLYIRLDEGSSLMEGGSLFRVFDGQGRLVYQSAGFTA